MGAVVLCCFETASLCSSYYFIVDSCGEGMVEGEMSFYF